MTEDDGSSMDRAGGGDGDLLLYDYFKHLTSLAVLALGGILLVVQNIDPEALQRFKVFAVFGFVSAAGIGAFHGASEIVKARTTNQKPGKAVYRLRTVAPMLLGGGVGVFLSLFIDALEIL